MGLSDEAESINKWRLVKPAKRRGYKVNDFRKLPLVREVVIPTGRYRGRTWSSLTATELVDCYEYWHCPDRYPGRPMQTMREMSAIEIDRRGITLPR